MYWWHTHIRFDICTTTKVNRFSCSCKYEIDYATCTRPREYRVYEDESHGEVVSVKTYALPKVTLAWERLQKISYASNASYRATAQFMLIGTKMLTPLSGRIKRYPDICDSWSPRGPRRFLAEL